MSGIARQLAGQRPKRWNYPLQRYQPRQPARNQREARQGARQPARSQRVTRQGAPRAPIRRRRDPQAPRPPAPEEPVIDNAEAPEGQGEAAPALETAGNAVAPAPQRGRRSGPASSIRTASASQQRRGQPPGSKNKPKDGPASATSAATAKKRGRPVGSKNKVKPQSPSTTTTASESSAVDHRSQEPSGSTSGPTVASPGSARAPLHEQNSPELRVTSDSSTRLGKIKFAVKINFY